MQDYREIESELRNACAMYKAASYEQSSSFCRMFKGKNICTPNTMGYYQRKNGQFVIEVSWGRGISDETMYGVTIIQRVDDNVAPYQRTDLSQAFHGLTEMTDFINSL